MLSSNLNKKKQKAYMENLFSEGQKDDFKDGKV